MFIFLAFLFKKPVFLWIFVPISLRIGSRLQEKNMTTKMEEFIQLTEKHALQDGANFSPTGTFGILRQSQPHPIKSEEHIPGIVAVAQGSKYCIAGEQRYDYSGGSLLGVLLPLPLQSEITVASPEKPFLAFAIMVNMARLTSVLHKLEQADSGFFETEVTNPSSIFSVPLTDKLLDPFIRLLDMMNQPRDAAVLSEAIMDEIYYRMLVDERGSELRALLQQRGEIQRISKAVEHIHKNIDQPVSVEGLANMVHMSRTTFYENFKSVMHVSPLQYAKAMKLHRAQTLILEGKKANEAAHLVGYTSPAQFSREYKRQFGFVPSETVLT
jgi:AraC-like DNA-binding protein